MTHAVWVAAAALAAGLLYLFAALLLACTAWRAHVGDSEGAYLSLLRTTTRMDGMLWGALVALTWPWLVRARAHATTIAGWSLLGLLALVLTIGNSMTYMGWGGVGVNVAVAAFVAATPGLADHPRWERATSWRPLVALGRASLALPLIGAAAGAWLLSRGGERRAAALGALGSSIGLGFLRWQLQRLVTEKVPYELGPARAVASDSGSLGRGAHVQRRYAEAQACFARRCRSRRRDGPRPHYRRGRIGAHGRLSD